MPSRMRERRAGPHTPPAWAIAGALLLTGAAARAYFAPQPNRRAWDIRRMDEDGESFDIQDTADQRALKARLVELREEHRALDAAIFALADQGGDALQLARLKKRKLALKDQIQWIEDRLTPDIIA